MSNDYRRCMLCLFYSFLIAIYAIAFAQELKEWYELKMIESNHNEPSEVSRIKSSLKEDTPESSEVGKAE